MKISKFIQCAILICCCSNVSAHDRVVLFDSDWSHGIDKAVQFQMPKSDSIEISSLNKLDGKFIRVKIDRESDYSKVANGTPRAEISFGGIFRFYEGSDYFVRWQTYIPSGYVFDKKQPELIAQIHQGPPAGYPPFALFISENNSYEIHSRTGLSVDSVNGFFGNPEADVDRLVQWQLHYRPDGSGSTGITEIEKDGVLVFSIKGVRNAYVNDNRAYLKLGLYKADWLKKPSDVESRTLYYGAVSVQRVIKGGQ